MPKKFLIFILLILTLRISLFYFFSSFQIDMSDWKGWSFKLQELGPSSFYSQNYFSDYFPGYLYILWFSGSLFKLLNIPINSQVFEIFIKTVTTFFDIGTAYYIFKICSKYVKKWRYFAPLLYLVNPTVIFNSSVWGQVDGVFTFFLVFSSYLLLEKKNIFKSSFFSSIGVLIKPQSLSLFPVWLVWSFKNFERTKFLKSLILGAAVFVLFSFPFFPNNPIGGIFNLAAKSQGVYKYTSIFAFNFWSLVGWWKPDNAVFILSYKVWGIILFLMSIIFIISPMIQNKVKNKQYYLAAALSFLSFFLLLTRMHERYLFPFLAFILIAAVLNKSKFLFIAYIIGSIVNFINLWFVYYYYGSIYNNPNSNRDLLYFIYTFINDNYKLFSILMVLLFVSIFTFYYKTYAKKS